MLIFTAESSGHNREYMMHVLDYVGNNPVERELCIMCPTVVGNELRHRYGHIRNTRIVDSFFDTTSDRGAGILRYIRNLRPLWFAFRWARRERQPDIFILNLNAYQPVLPLMSLVFPDIRIHSILFFPFVRMSRLDIGKARGFRGKIKFLRKKWLLKFAARFSRLGTVFVLNDEETVRRLNHLLGQANPIVRFLPDPVPVWEGSGRTLRPSGKCTFLMIGALRRRKGVFEVLEAFRILKDKEALRGAKLILAGNPAREDRDALISAVEALRADCPNLEIETDFRELSEAEFVDRFTVSTVVLVPYTRSEGSSGILGHAARANRPVVGPRDGLIGDLIRDYELGYTLDDVSAESLSDYFERAISSAGDFTSSPRQREFVEERKPENFARILLNSAC